MNLHEYTFVDWRPIASFPIKTGVLLCGDWTDYSPTNFDQDLLDGEWADIRIQYRFVCRDDGLIIFSIEAPTRDLRFACAIADKISYRIKELSGHCHTFDTDAWNNNASTNLTSYPVLCETLFFSSFSEFCSFAIADAEISKVKARSAATDTISDRAALLTIKMLYSRLFDRVAKRVEEYDNSLNALNWNLMTPKGRCTIYAILAVISFVAMLAFLLDDLFIWGREKQILTGSVYAASAFLVLAHVRFNLNEIMTGRIRLYRKLSAYYCHGNNLSRVLWKIYSGPAHIAGHDYDPIIKLTEDRINASVRRMQTYTFMFSAVVALVGMCISIVS
jgi:hypothetical protein